MSKNFELLHNISNEKDLFQTLDGWESIDEAPASVEQGRELNERIPAGNQQQSQQSPLPDVFQAVVDSLGSLDLETSDLTLQNPKAARNPIYEQKKVQGETQSANAEGRFPISRNLTTRLNSDLDVPEAWTKLKIEPTPSEEVELELEPEGLPSNAIWEHTNQGKSPVEDAQPQRAWETPSSSDQKVSEQSPAKEEKTNREPGRPRPLPNLGVDEGKSSGRSRARKSGARSAYKDPRRESIAHEEELKLVQRIFLAEENSPRMVLFSGFERDIGCSSICFRASEILAAQAEGSVCLIDMGFRAPSLHEYCGVPNERGLADALVESNPIQEFARQLSPANLWVIPSGSSASQLNFAKVADRLRARLEELRKAFRFVVINSGSLWLNADAMLISKWTDGVVLILEAHSTRRDTARRIKESLAAANARVLGVVLNNRTYPIPETLYSRL